MPATSVNGRILTLPPERRSLTGLKPDTCRAKVPAMATVLMVWTSKAGCKPALRFGGSVKMRPR